MKTFEVYVKLVTGDEFTGKVDYDHNYASLQAVMNDTTQFLLLKTDAMSNNHVVINKASIAHINEIENDPYLRNKTI